MTTADPDHPITLAREPHRVAVLLAGHELGASADVLLLSEGGYPPVRYFPRGDIAMEFLRKTDKTSHCPYKGQASYYTLYRDGQVLENAVWSYEDPLPAVDAIAGRLAFYPQHVEFKLRDLTPAETEAAAPEAEALDVDAVVRHTDSGSGASQAEHWPANVEGPDDAEGVAQPDKGTGSI